VSRDTSTVAVASSASRSINRAAARLASSCMTADDVPADSQAKAFASVSRDTSAAAVSFAEACSSVSRVTSAVAIVSASSRSVSEGLVDNARHVVGCHSTQGTRDRVGAVATAVAEALAAAVAAAAGAAVVSSLG